jgi:hypothetical protein
MRRPSDRLVNTCRMCVRDTAARSRDRPAAATGSKIDSGSAASTSSEIPNSAVGTLAASPAASERGGTQTGQSEVLAGGQNGFGRRVARDEVQPRLR